MKELRFRAWDGKKMIDDVIPVSETAIVELFEYEHQITDVEAVEQYTGLKDKNGKEIYVGDILLDDIGQPCEHWTVKFDDGKFIGEIQGVAEDLFELTDLEIIGNIHENTELLENKE